MAIRKGSLRVLILGTWKVKCESLIVINTSQMAHGEVDYNRIPDLFVVLFI